MCELETHTNEDNVHLLIIEVDLIDVAALQPFSWHEYKNELYCWPQYQPDQ